MWSDKPPAAHTLMLPLLPNACSNTEKKELTLRAMKRFVLYCVLFIGVGSQMAATLHPFHVSICMIDHNPQTQHLEISHKIFVEDLELMFKDMGKGKLWLGEDKENGEADALIEAYLRNHFAVQVNGQNAPWQWVGREIEQDVLWVYLETEKVPQPQKITVRYTVLTETFNDQSNLIHAKVNGTIKSEHTNGIERQKTIEFP